VEQATAQRWACLNRLGNLTIVTQPLDTALSNRLWLKKRTELNKHSKLLLNARLSERHTWDEHHRRERTVACAAPGDDLARGRRGELVTRRRTSIDFRRNWRWALLA
jgi:hypothetical protein